MLQGGLVAVVRGKLTLRGRCGRTLRPQMNSFGPPMWLQRDFGVPAGALAKLTRGSDRLRETASFLHLRGVGALWGLD